MKQSIIDQISNFEVVSFDILDTVLFRKVSNPETVFDIIGEKIRDKTFRVKRIKSQIKAFESMLNAGRNEITIAEIYDNFPDSYDNRMKLMNLEILVEKQVIYPNLEMVDVINYCIMKHKKVVFISDMYLSTEFFQQIFLHFGIKEKDNIFVSSTMNATKRDSGELFAKVSTKLKIPPHKIIHIGDNYHSDILQSQKTGFSAIYYPVIRSQTQNLSESIILGLQELIKVKHNSRGEYFYWGANYGSLAMIPFLDWVSQRVQQDEIDLALCVSRDSFMVNELWTSLVERKYFYCSRVSLYLATLNEENFDFCVQFFLDGYYKLSIKEFFTRIGVECPNQKQIICAGLVNKDQIIDNEALLEKVKVLFHLHKKELLKVGVSNRRNFYHYLLQIGVRDKHKIAFIDVGWLGTSQNILKKIVDDMFDDVIIHGYYFGIQNNNVVKDRLATNIMSGYICDNNSEEKLSAFINENRILVELFFSAPHHSVIGYQSVNNIIEPKYDIERGSSSNFCMIKRQINAGIKEFHNELMSLLETLGISIDLKKFNDLFYNFLQNTPINVVRQIGKLNNFDTWSSTVNYRTFFALDKLDISKYDSCDVINAWKKGFELLNS